MDDLGGQGGHADWRTLEKFGRLKGPLVTRLEDDFGPGDILVMPSMSLTSGDEDDLNMTFSDEAGG
jgi:hypothetical protein